jgi:hypothetical protein
VALPIGGTQRELVEGRGKRSRQHRHLVRANLELHSLLMHHPP